MTCRCGAADDADPHPCHNEDYTCRKPAVRRIVTLGPAILSGMTMKFSAYETFACDECWAGFIAKVEKVKADGESR